MNFEQLGEPIKFDEYMDRYEEMIRHVLSELSFVDFDAEKIKALLRAEMRKAETSFYIFYDQNRREPDYAFLQRKITEFGVHRLELFQPEEILSVDNFIHKYIELLKIEKLLSGLVFEEQDLFLSKNMNVIGQRNTLRCKMNIFLVTNRIVFQSTNTFSS
ncbi:hypothetical protein [Enterococcus faecium]|uniref:hypothetical protein n=1 Tax=Enterococcus faecium TaxID=1352 RepID=UPI001F513F80|nr:hypothetical protein [Enterococcus faecium]